MVNSIPSWLSKHLKSDQEIREISDRVAQAEKNTNAEIVPMIVRSSALTGHVPALLFALILILCLFVIHSPPWWGYGVLIVVSALGAWGGSKISMVKRWLTPDADSERAVALRAEAEFFEAGLNKTQDATGILLFVSLEEHMAIVLADQSIASKLPPESWQEVVQLLIAGIKNNNMKSGFIDAIAKCESIVAPHFPKTHGNPDELKNHLIVKE